MTDVGVAAGGVRTAAWPGASVALALRRLAAVLAVAWLGVDVVGVATAPAGSFRAVDVVLAAMAIGVLSGVVVGVRPDAPGGLLVAGTAAAAATGCWLAQPGYGDGNGFVVYWLPGLVAVTAGFLLGRRDAQMVCVVTAVAASALVLVRTAPVEGWGDAWTKALASACFTVCDGAAALLVAGALHTVAAAADRELVAAQESRTAEAEARSRRAQAFELAARLHDTVVNTLSAIVTRGDVLDVGSVRQAAQEAVQVAEDVLAGDREHPGDLRRQVAGWLDGGSGLGYPEVTLVGARPEDVVLLLAGMRPAAAAAVVGAVHEVLTNVTKHSGVRYARIEVHPDGAPQIRVSDDGAGFDGRVVDGRGLDLSVLRRCRAAGVEVTMVSHPGRGTTVTFLAVREEHEVGPGDAGVDGARLLASVGAAFVRGIALCIFALCAGLTLITFGRPGTPATVVALAALAFLTWVGTRPDAHRWCSAPRVAAVLALVPAVVMLPGLGESGCDRLGTAWWGTDGALVPFVLLVFLSPRRWPLPAAAAVFWAAVAVVAWSVTDDGCASSAVMSGVLDSVVVLAILSFRESLARLAVRASRAGDAAVVARRSTVESDVARRVRETDVALAVSGAAAVLQRIGRGADDPRSETVREECALHERHLRQLTQLDPGLGELGARLAAALTVAHRTGVHLVLRTGQVDVPGRAAARAVGAVLGQVLAGCARGDTVTLTQLGDSSPRITITSPVRGSLHRDVAQDVADAAGWDVRVFDLDDQRLVELCWRGR